MTAARVDKVVVGISGSLGNLAALHAAVAEARRRDARLVAVCAWLPVGGEITYMRAPCGPLLDQWRQQARDTLRDAFDDAFGGLPSELALTLLALRGEPGATLVGIADGAHDLLVVGTGRRGRLTRLRHRGVSRYCVGHARCPVLTVPQPAMLSELRSGLRAEWSLPVEWPTTSDHSRDR